MTEDLVAARHFPKPSMIFRNVEIRRPTIIFDKKSTVIHIAEIADKRLTGVIIARDRAGRNQHRDSAFPKYMLPKVDVKLRVSNRQVWSSFQQKQLNDGDK
ncbi:MAG: hypothetical protein AB7P20_05420 [Rhizobiaceae bacterium]